MIAEANITVVVISSKEDFKDIESFIDDLPKLMQKVIVLTEQGANSEFVKEINPFTKVYKYGYEQFSFSEARNWANEQVKTDWIISLDMDERICLREEELIKLKSCPDSIGGFQIPILNFDMHSQLISKHEAVRIFRKGIKWKYHVHEDISEDLEEAGYNLAKHSIVIKHFGYEDLNAPKYYKKLKRNYGLSLKDIIKYPNDLYVRNNLHDIITGLRRFENDNSG